MASGEPFCDFAFPVRGNRVPYEHGYLLYSALSGVCPALHERQDAGIFQIPSTSTGEGRGTLGKDATLKIRGPASLYPSLVQLAGEAFELEGDRIRLGVPAAYPLRPAQKLEAALVVIKGYMEKGDFEEAVGRQLDALEVDCSTEIGDRNVVRIKGKSIVGFGVELADLDANDSLLVMQEGIGGRRKMGCGLFEARSN